LQTQDLQRLTLRLKIALRAEAHLRGYRHLLKYMAVKSYINSWKVGIAAWVFENRFPRHCCVCDCSEFQLYSWNLLFSHCCIKVVWCSVHVRFPAPDCSAEAALDSDVIGRGVLCCWMYTWLENDDQRVVQLQSTGRTRVPSQPGDVTQSPELEVCWHLIHELITNVLWHI